MKRATHTRAFFSDLRPVRRCYASEIITFRSMKSLIRASGFPIIRRYKIDVATGREQCASLQSSLSVLCEKGILKLPRHLDASKWSLNLAENLNMGILHTDDFEEVAGRGLATDAEIADSELLFPNLGSPHDVRALRPRDYSSIDAVNVVVDIRRLANKPFDADTLEAKFRPLAANIFRGCGFSKYPLHTEWEYTSGSKRNTEPLTVPLLVNDTIWVVKGVPDMTVYEINGDQDTLTTKALGICDIKRVTSETATGQTCAQLVLLANHKMQQENLEQVSCFAYQFRSFGLRIFRAEFTKEFFTALGTGKVPSAQIPVVAWPAAEPCSFIDSPSSRATFVRALNAMSLVHGGSQEGESASKC